MDIVLAAVIVAALVVIDDLVVKFLDAKYKRDK